MKLSEGQTVLTLVGNQFTFGVITHVWPKDKVIAVDIGGSSKLLEPGQFIVLPK